MERKQLSEKEIAELDKQIEDLQNKVYKAKKEYDSLSDQLSDLLTQRYPERQAEYIKDVLYDAYSRSHKSLELIVSYMLNENLDDEGTYWR